MTRRSYDDTVIGVDRDGCLIMLDCSTGNKYRGPTLAEYGPENLTTLEAHLVGAVKWRLPPKA